MKLFVLHDTDGTIQGFAIPDESVRGEIHPVPNDRTKATEIDISELVYDDAKTQTRLIELMSSHRIRLGEGAPSLVPKT